MSLAFTFVDLLVVAIVIVSTIFAIWRGFISETLSIVGWAAAAFASLYFGPWVAVLMARMISPLWLADLAGYAAVFVVVLIPISFASFRFSESVKKSAAGPLDRSLGAAFGVVRGLAIVGGLYILFSLVVPLKDHPKSVREARTLPLIQSSAEVLIALAPSDERHVARERIGSPSPANLNTDPGTASAGPHPKTFAAALALPAPRPKPKLPALAQTTQKHAGKTYGANDRHALDNLIQNSGDGGGKP
jgi:membrane protein required for colicin V production